MTLSIRAEDPCQPDTRALIDASDKLSASLYAPEERYPIDVESLVRPDCVFFVAREERRAIGCAALRMDPEGYGELKRMFVEADSRGCGVGRALLTRVEQEARQRGFFLLRLETGVYQKAAIRLYESAGFYNCDCFGTYRPGKNNLFLEKRLAEA